MHRSNSPGGLGSYIQHIQANRAAQGDLRPYMMCAWGMKGYQEIGRVYSGGGARRSKVGRVAQR